MTATVSDEQNRLAHEYVRDYWPDYVGDVGLRGAERPSFNLRRGDLRRQ